MKTKILPKLFCISFILYSLAGCAKLEHLDQLLTLKDMSDEADRMDKYVKEQDRKFELLLKVVADDSIKNYTTRKAIVKAFGDPAYSRKVVKDGADVEESLYRYAKKFFNSDKVYFYFDASGKLVTWNYLPAETQVSAR